MDSYKYLPRSFRAGYEGMGMQAEAPVWAPLRVPVERATIALLTSAGLFVKSTQERFDEEGERQNPLWGDPTYRVIPRDVRQDEIGCSHLHLNRRDFYTDFNVALPIRAFAELEAEGKIGHLAEDHYAFMGYQERRCREWKERYGPEVARHLNEAGVDALVIAPA